MVISTRILAIERNLYPNHFLTSLAQYRNIANDFSKQKQEAESIIFIFSYNYELDKYILDKTWDKALAIVPEMQQRLKKYQDRVGEEFQLTCYYRFACTFFFNGMYQQAADNLSLVLHNFAHTLRPDVYHISLLLHIVVHYELDNRKLLPHLIQTAKYHLEKQAALYQAERLLLRYFKKLQRKSIAKEKEALLALQKALLLLFSNNNHEKHLLDIFDFLAWIQDKVQRLTSIKTL